MNPLDVLALERAGFAVFEHNEGKHVVLRGHGLKVDYWPRSRKFMVHGQVFRTSLQRLIADVQSKKYKPLDTPPSRCKRCGKKIYWTKSTRGNWTPLDRDGGSHLAHCKISNDPGGVTPRRFGGSPST